MFCHFEDLEKSKTGVLKKLLLVQNIPKQCTPKVYFYFMKNNMLICLTMEENFSVGLHHLEIHIGLTLLSRPYLHIVIPSWHHSRHYWHHGRPSWHHGRFSWHHGIINRSCILRYCRIYIHLFVIL